MRGRTRFLKAGGFGPKTKTKAPLGKAKAKAKAEAKASGTPSAAQAVASPLADGELVDLDASQEAADVDLEDGDDDVVAVISEEDEEHGVEEREVYDGPRTIMTSRIATNVQR